MGPSSVGPIVTTTLPAFPIALAIDSALSKLDSTALRRFNCSLDKICGYDAKAGNTKVIIVSPPFLDYNISNSYPKYDSLFLYLYLKILFYYISINIDQLVD